MAGKKSPQVDVYMNHGRWLMDCPVCGTPILVIDEKELICPACFPDMLAKIFLPLPSPPYPPGATRPADDFERIAKARQKAREQGQAWRPKFPAERQQIERVLRKRRMENMNWKPGETLADLSAENKAHGLGE